jgi:hypothetical protein
MTKDEPKWESEVMEGYNQAIETYYIGPSNVKGSRIKAKTASGISVTLGYDSALSIAENHSAACKALVDKLNWGGVWLGGGSKRGYYFVMVKGVRGEK